jgi:hypothetical protein
MARIALPDAGSVSDGMFPPADKIDQQAHEQFIGESFAGWENGLVPGECVVSFFRASERDSNYYHAVTNMCRTAFKYDTTGNYRRPLIKLNGNPFPMNAEYITMAQKMGLPSSNGYISIDDYKRRMKGGNVHPSGGASIWDDFISNYKSFHPKSAEIVACKANAAQATQTLAAAQALTDKHALELAQLAVEKREVTELQRGCREEREQLEAAKKSFKKRLKVVAQREQAVSVREQLAEVAAKLEQAAMELLDACDTVEKDLIGGMVGKVLEKLGQVTTE